MKLVLLSALLSTASGFSAPSSLRSSTALGMNKAELKETADYIARPGFGLLACDESTKTVGARLESIGMGECVGERTAGRCEY